MPRSKQLSTKMRILFKENEAKYLIEESEDAADKVRTLPMADGTYMYMLSAHYSRGQFSPRSTTIQCANGSIIVECCSTKPSVWDISAAVQEAWPDQDQASALALAFIVAAKAKDKVKVWTKGQTLRWAQQNGAGSAISFDLGRCWSYSWQECSCSCPFF